MFYDIESKNPIMKEEEIIKIFKDHYKKPLIIFTSSNSEKLSLHVIIPDMILRYKESQDECEKFLETHMELSDMIDFAVYKRIQNLRCPNSCKLNSERFKRFHPLSDVKEITRDCFIQTQDLPVNDWNEFRDKYSKHSHEKPNSNLNAITTESIISKYFLRRTNTIYNRIKPSFCVICNRIHEHDNISIYKGTVKCYRNPTKTCKLTDFLTHLK